MKLRSAKSVALDDQGISMVEVLITVVVMSVAVLSVAGAGFISAAQLEISRAETQRWGIAQQQLEKIAARGYDNLVAGSDSEYGHDLTWSVSGVNPKQITLVVERPGVVAQDTFVTYMADFSP